ncbi:MAG: FixH family protein [Polymorphobacter sp.]
MSRSTPRPFTGYHMAAILVAFFGVVVAVNLVMARFAISTFGGTVVDNSYVASQKYNGWLREARDQKALGWTMRLTLDPDRSPQLAVTKAGAALAGLTASGVATHPLGRAPDIALTFYTDADRILRAHQTLPPGRWQVRVVLQQGQAQARLLETLQ